MINNYRIDHETWVIVVNQFITTEGRTIPKGTNIAFLIDALHRVEEFWDEPNEFRPERFSPENSKNRDPYSYIPFSVGKKLAELCDIIMRWIMRLESKVVAKTLSWPFQYPSTEFSYDTQYSTI